MIVTLSGPSGSGKSTLLECIKARYPYAQPLESVTTREPRRSDVPGEYTHVGDAEFDELVERDEFLWHVPQHGYRFGTKRASIDAALKEGLVLATLNVEGVERLSAYVKAIGKSSLMHSFYLLVPDRNELRRRLYGRKDTKDVEERIKECLNWDDDAFYSPAEFIFLDAKKSKEEVLAEALSHLKL